jgi:hypothetical protein
MKKQKEAAATTTALTHFEKSNQQALQPSNFKSSKRLTKDVTSITQLNEAIVMCQSEIYTIEMGDPANPGCKRPVAACDVLDCMSGQEYVLICGAVLASTWQRFEGQLIGTYFAIRTGEIPPGKRYRKVDVVQLERVE